MNNRQAKINDEIARALGALIPALKDPRLNSSVLTVTRVECARDLSQCKVYVSPFDAEPKDVIRGLKSASGFLRKGLADALNLRHTPQLFFELDDSIKTGTAILEIMKNL